MLGRALQPNLKLSLEDPEIARRIELRRNQPRLGEGMKRLPETTTTKTVYPPYLFRGWRIVHQEGHWQLDTAHHQDLVVLSPSADRVNAPSSDIAIEISSTVSRTGCITLVLPPDARHDDWVLIREKISCCLVVRKEHSDERYAIIGRARILNFDMTKGRLPLYDPSYFFVCLDAEDLLLLALQTSEEEVKNGIIDTTVISGSVRWLSTPVCLYGQSASYAISVDNPESICFPHEYEQINNSLRDQYAKWAPKR